jgi:nucleoside-diphosphate-sugar epimerase
MSNKKVLVAGASGLVGHAAVQHFAALPDWEVVGISRRTPADIAGATLLSVDLTDAEACARTFRGLGDVTHVVYAALHEVPGLFPGWTQDDTIARNGMMLQNLFERCYASRRTSSTSRCCTARRRTACITQPSAGRACGTRCGSASRDGSIRISTSSRRTTCASSSSAARGR